VEKWLCWHSVSARRRWLAPQHMRMRWINQRHLLFLTKQLCSWCMVHVWCMVVVHGAAGAVVAGSWLVSLFSLRAKTPRFVANHTAAV